ncbi:MULTISPECIES: hypothetical protein [Streptomyces]|uniref:hypothetical protein n=1 Tax=Streptomyces TaxID=1883 RepID=UPI0011082810|nr:MULTISPECIES: hypothetical protein [Streptomyces]
MSVGDERTSAYEAGLARHLREQDVAVVETDRLDRKARRWQGKSDPVDAEAAARPDLAQRAPPAYPSSATAGWRPCGACASSASARSADALTCQR